MNKTIKTILFAVLALIIIAIGIPVIAGFTSTFAPGKAIQMAKQKAQEKSQVFSPIGIWQANGGMASGWVDRYNFYSSGTYVFSPNEMQCLTQKTTKIGSWKLESNLLTLSTTKQIISTFKCTSDGLGKFISSKEVVLKQPDIKQLSVINNGIQEGDIYPSITLNGEQYWKFSDDPTGYYKDNEFPEPAVHSK